MVHKKCNVRYEWLRDIGIVGKMIYSQVDQPGTHNKSLAREISPVQLLLLSVQCLVAESVWFNANEIMFGFVLHHPVQLLMG